MKLPPLYEKFCALPRHLPDKGTVCKLVAPLYRTKQGAHEWYKKLKEIFTELKFTMLKAEYTIVACATDDFTIITCSEKCQDDIKNSFWKYFDIVDKSTTNFSNIQLFDFLGWTSESLTQVSMGLYQGNTPFWNHHPVVVAIIVGTHFQVYPPLVFLANSMKLCS